MLEGPARPAIGLLAAVVDLVAGPARVIGIVDRGGALVARCVRRAVDVRVGALGRVSGGIPLRLGNAMLDGFVFFVSCNGCFNSGMGASLFLGCSDDTSSVAFLLREFMSTNEDVDEDKDEEKCPSGSESRRGKRDILAMAIQLQPCAGAQVPPRLTRRTFSHTRELSGQVIASRPTHKLLLLARQGWHGGTIVHSRTNRLQFVVHIR